MSKSEITEYLRTIGRKGGQKSKREIDPEIARKMQEASVLKRQQNKLLKSKDNA